MSSITAGPYLREDRPRGAPGGYDGRDAAPGGGTRARPPRSVTVPTPSHGRPLRGPRRQRLPGPTAGTGTDTGTGSLSRANARPARPPAGAARRVPAGALVRVH